MYLFNCACQLSSPYFNKLSGDTLSLSLSLSPSPTLLWGRGLFSLSMISVMRQATTLQERPSGRLYPCNDYVYANLAQFPVNVRSVFRSTQSLGLFLSFRLQMERMGGLEKLPSYPLRLCALEHFKMERLPLHFPPKPERCNRYRIKSLSLSLPPPLYCSLTFVPMGLFSTLDLVSLAVLLLSRRNADAPRLQR